MKASISEAWDSITGVFDSIGEGLSQVGGWFSDRCQDIKDSWNNMKDGLSEGYNEVKDKVFDAFSNAWEGVSNFFTDDSTAIGDRKSTRLNSSHVATSYAVFCLKKKKNKNDHSGADSER